MKKVIVLFFLIILSKNLYAQGVSEYGIILHEKQKSGKKIRYNFNYIEGFSEVVDTFIERQKNVYIDVAIGNQCDTYIFVIGTFDNLSINDSHIKSTNRYYQPVDSKKRVPIILDLDKKFTALDNYCFNGILWVYVENLNSKFILKVTETSFYPID